MTTDEYLDALHKAIEDGDQQAAAVLKMLESRGLIPKDPPALVAGTRD
jgi:hypothetical protein